MTSRRGCFPIDTDSSLWRDRYDWIKNNNIRFFKLANNGKVFIEFSNSEDAVLFQLTWL